MTVGTLARTWYVLSALRECIPLFALYALYMQSNGLTPIEVSGLFIVWSLSALLFEVPSGVLADRFERRFVLCASRLVQALAFAVWWWQPTFVGFAAGFLLWGLAGSLWSGTAEAWLYECLHARAAHTEFQRVYGTASACSTVGIGLALLTGGVLARDGMTWPFTASIAVTLAVGAAVLVLPKAPRTTTRDDADESPAPPLAAALIDFRRSAVVRHAALAIGFGLVFYGCFEEYVPLLFDAAGLSVASIGVWYAVCYGARAVGMAVAGRSGRVFTPAPRGALIVSGALLGAGPILFGLPGLVMGSVLYFALNGIAEVWIVDELQRGQSGAARATVMSLARLGILATGPLVYVLTGAWAADEGWQAAAWLAAIGTTLVGVVLAWAHRRATQVYSH